MRPLLLIPALLLATTFAARAAANPALEGYANDASFTERVKKLDESDFVSVATLAKTEGGREILAITIAQGDASKKPALAVIGGVEPGHVAGTELALRLAERLVAERETEAVRKLLDAMTIYVIPRSDPDAVEKALTAPYRTPGGNNRKTDDDRDGQFGEDPPNDLNGDGWITLMRVADDSGNWMPHPNDARVLIEADPKKNERGQYRVFVEGRDDDGDQQQSEDGGDGVNFNRNWPHRYQAFEKGTGPNMVSETETRAVADFLFDRANVVAVLCFSPQDNLFHPWKADAGKDKQRIRTTILSADAPYVDFLASKYRDLHGGKDAAESTWPGGTFAEWSYFQYSRWTFAARPWWIPKVAEKAKEGEEKKPAEEKRGADDLNALRWFEQEKIEGFVEWQKVDHPDFPGKTVEVGGFKPFYREHPPVKVLDELTGKYLTFLGAVHEHSSRVAIRDTKVEPLGAGVFRVTAKVASTGYLPTLPEMGEVTGIHQRLQVELVAPEKSVYLKGSKRVKLGRIDATNDREVTWLVRLPDAKGDGKLRVWSPEIGVVEAAVKFE